MLQPAATKWKGKPAVGKGATGLYQSEEEDASYFLINRSKLKYYWGSYIKMIIFIGHVPENNTYRMLVD